VRHRPVRYLVCNSLGDYTAVPGVLRSCCGCEAQIWVTMHMLGFVESGELRPRCWDCQDQAGTRVGLHVAERVELERLGRSAEGAQLLDEMNDYLGFPTDRS
jgi:hypothetical protein